MAKIPLLGDAGAIKDHGLGGMDHNFLTARIEDLVRWSRARSCWPATFGLACCAIEMMATGAAHYDLGRYGMEVFRASPRQADLMIVAGRLSQKMAPVLRQIYDQMMEPKWVISMGVCASSGGMFNNYAIVQGVDQVVPVDVYAPGCPPSPETLMHAILTLHGLIETGELLRRREEQQGGAGLQLETVSTGGATPVALGGTSVVTGAEAPAESEAAEEALPTRYGVPVTWSRGQVVLHPSPAELLDVASAAREDGFDFLSDVTAVDYLVHPGRTDLPPGAAPERFEVVVTLRNHRDRSVLRLRVQVPEAAPVVPTLFDLWPGSEALGREVFDMFGIVFADHPDMTRILMPEDWQGHPLRKDFAVGRIPVQFKDAPSTR